MKEPLITAQQVVDKVIPRKNLSLTFFKDLSIKLAEKKYFRDVIGEDFLNELIDQNDGDSLSADNKTLLDDHLKDALAYFVVTEALNHMHIDMSNAGLTTLGTEFTSPVTAAQKAQLQSFFRENGEVLRKEMVKFLVDAQDDDDTKYPLFDSTKDLSEEMQVVGGIIFNTEDEPVRPDANIDKGQSLRDC